MQHGFVLVSPSLLSVQYNKVFSFSILNKVFVTSLKIEVVKDNERLPGDSGSVHYFDQHCVTALCNCALL